MSPNFHRSWYDHNWDWALILLFALVLLAGIVLWTTYADRPQAAAIPDDATTGQSTRPGLPTYCSANAFMCE
jgi:hypothetical protein